MENADETSSGVYLGAILRAIQSPQLALTLQLTKLGNLRELAKVLENDGFYRRKVGGGGQIRTVDAADMSRVL